MPISPRLGRPLHGDRAGKLRAASGRRIKTARAQRERLWRQFRARCASSTITKGRFGPRERRRCPCSVRRKADANVTRGAWKIGESRKPLRPWQRMQTPCPRSRKAPSIDGLRVCHHGACAARTWARENVAAGGAAPLCVVGLNTERRQIHCGQLVAEAQRQLRLCRRPAWGRSGAIRRAIGRDAFVAAWRRDAPTWR